MDTRKHNMAPGRNKDSAAHDRTVRKIPFR